MKIKTYLTVAALAAIAFFSGCGKDGGIGATGPTGATGPAGPQGDTGLVNAHAIRFTTPMIDNPTFFWYQTLTDSDITQDIINSGAVMVYEQLKLDTNIWYPLPWTLGNPAEVWSFNMAVNTVGLSFAYAAGGDPANPDTNVFKVVVIAADARQAYPNLDLKNYAQVKQTLRLRD